MVASSGCLGRPARCLPLVALLAEMLLPFPPARPSQGFSHRCRVEGSPDPSQLETERERKALEFVWGFAAFVQRGGGNPSSNTTGYLVYITLPAFIKGCLTPDPYFSSLFVAEEQKWHHLPSSPLPIT